jgi:hypothetical protein
MKEPDIKIWKTKLDWIAENGGMALLITHPDYMAREQDERQTDEYPIERYREFLDYAQRQYAGQYWHALPRDVARFWRQGAFAVDHRDVARKLEITLC